MVVDLHKLADIYSAVHRCDFAQVPEFHGRLCGLIDQHRASASITIVPDSDDDGGIDGSAGAAVAHGPGESGDAVVHGVVHAESTIRRLTFAMNSTD